MGSGTRSPRRARFLSALIVSSEQLSSWLRRQSKRAGRFLDQPVARPTLGMGVIWEQCVSGDGVAPRRTGRQRRCNSSGSLVILMAIRRASSRVSRFAALRMCLPHSHPPSSYRWDVTPACCTFRTRPPCAQHLAFVLIALTWADRGYAEEDRGSAGYLVALCKTYLDLVENEAETLQNLGRTEPARLTAAGVCVGFVVGVLETLRSVNLSCIRKDIGNTVMARGHGGALCAERNGVQALPVHLPWSPAFFLWLSPSSLDRA